MRSAFLVLSACAAVSHAFSDSSACDDADASSLLQSRKLVHVQRAQKTDANDLLRSLRDVATSLTEGSAVTMTPADVNAAIGTASTALHTMLPLLEQQHALAQQEIRHALAAVQTCHNEHGGEVRARLEQAVIREVVEKDGCEETLNDAIEAEHEACAGQGDNPNCLCDEARTAITDQTALCAAVTETFEAVYCELQVSCGAFQQCHADEMEVYSALRADIEAAMTSRQEEYRTFMQVDCLMNLITTAMLSGTPIDHSSLVACDDVSVDHLAINFPVPPPAPTGCPAPQSGDPQCGADYAMVHDGHCASGWISGSNTLQLTISACSEVCRSNANCGYFAFAQESGSSTNCALYTAAGGCADDNNFVAYNAYQMLVAPAVPRPAGDTALLSGSAQCPDCTCEVSAPDPHWGNSGCQSMFDDVVRWGSGVGLHLQNDASLTVTFPLPQLIDHVALQQIQTHGNTYRRGDFAIETFNNGVWTVRARVDDLSVQDLPMDGTGRFTFQFAQPVIATKVRMSAGNPQNGAGNIFRLEELQVYGTTCSLCNLLD